MQFIFISLLPSLILVIKSCLKDNVTLEYGHCLIGEFLILLLKQCPFARGIFCFSLLIIKTFLSLFYI